MTDNNLSKHLKQEVNLDDEGEENNESDTFVDYLYALQPDERAIRDYKAMRKLLISKYGCPEEIIPLQEDYYKKISYVRMMLDPVKKKKRFDKLNKKKGKLSVDVKQAELVVNNSAGSPEGSILSGFGHGTPKRTSQRASYSRLSQQKQKIESAEGYLNMRKDGIESIAEEGSSAQNQSSDDELQVVDECVFNQSKGHVAQQQPLIKQQNDLVNQQHLNEVNELPQQDQLAASDTMQQQVLDHIKTCQSCGGKAAQLAQACLQGRATTVNMLRMRPMKQNNATLHHQSAMQVQNQQSLQSEDSITSFRIQTLTGDILDYGSHSIAVRVPKIEIDLSNIQWSVQEDHLDNPPYIKKCEEAQTYLDENMNDIQEPDRNIINRGNQYTDKPPIMLAPAPKLKNAKNARQARKVARAPILIEDEERKSLEEAFIRHSNIKMEVFDDQMIDQVEEMDKNDQGKHLQSKISDLRRREMIVKWMLAKGIVADQDNNEQILAGTNIFKELISDNSKKQELEQFVQEKQCRLGGFIASGGEAVVFKVVGENGKRLCLRAEYLNDSRNDLKIRQKLSSIYPEREVQVFGFTETTHYNLTLMNYLPLCLSQFVGALKDYMWHPQTCTAIMYSVTAALLRCHDVQVAHLDLKTENCLLDEKLNVMLTDFAGSKNLRSRDAKKPLTHLTPSIMPPEFSYSGDLVYPLRIETIDWKAVDIWSLGLVFYTIATRQALDDDMVELTRKGKFPGIEYKNAPTEFLEYCEDVNDLLSWIFDVNPHDRPDCTEILDHNLFATVPRPEDEDAQLDIISLIHPRDRKHCLKLIQLSFECFDEQNFYFDEMEPKEALSSFGAVASRRK